MSERGVGIAHTTILRRVQHYTPEFEKRWLRPTLGLKSFRTAEVVISAIELAEKIKEETISDEQAWSTYGIDAGNLASCPGCITEPLSNPQSKIHLHRF